MKTHIRVVGILHIVWNLTGVLAAVFVLLVYFLGAAAFGIASADAGEPQTGFVVTSVLTGLGLLGGCALLVPCLPGFVAGIGLLGLHGWARWVIVVVSVLNLFVLGLGTILGIYSLWALLNERSRLVFEGGPS